MILRHLGQPGFLTLYVAHLARSGEKTSPENAIGGLIQSLEAIGITPETGLKAIAA